MKIHFLTGITGISPRIAKRLLAHFKTAKAVINATEEELMKVEGIGESTAEKVWNLINIPYQGEIP